MKYETEIATGVNITVLPKTHRHYELSVEYNKGKLQGNPPKVLWSNPFVDGTVWEEYHGSVVWDSNWDFMLQYPDNYEDREITLYCRFSEYKYSEKSITVRQALTFETVHRFAHEKPKDTKIYVISLQMGYAMETECDWLKSVFAPLNHYIVFDNKSDFENAKKEFENAGRPLRERD